VPAPSGDLSSFTVETFTADDVTHRVLRKGNGPAVVVMAELRHLAQLGVVRVLGFLTDRLGLTGRPRGRD
jgi:hypothetical protein